jgi:CIC family chloride channel protein
VGFWAAVILTGAGAGIGAVALTTLLETAQHVMWPGPNLLDAATHAGAWRHVWVLLGAGVLTGVGQIILRRLTSGNGIDITEAISEFGGQKP